MTERTARRYGHGEETTLGSVRRWILLDGDRWVLAGALACTLFVALVLLGTLDGGFRAAVAAKDPIETVFAGLATGIITGVTLVVTIDQLVLSQQLAPLADQREQLDESLQFRREVETLVEDTSPAEPGAFIAALVDTADRRADDLRRAATGGDPAFEAAVTRFVAGHARAATAVDARLDARYLRFGALRAALEYDYAYRVNEARRIRHEFESVMTDRQRDAVDDVLDALRFLGPAREHVRGLYFQAELVKLSRVILTAAVPALGIALAAVFFLDAADLVGSVLGVDLLLLAVAAAATVAVVPFLVLVAYVLRIVTIVEWTLTTGEFVLHEAERPDER
ncbi:hypothetical protein J2752_001315 [Halarchaeum rubridurum]|uniref:DUF4239 domain-containing protein n=1 Tax=Halarchaeum rubridurum TaxID=489911 RepID=A0A830FYP9_9EURY|nr:hypothetical protein [Halarchaeum rubridurum]MBP1954403.1 hypothetical protein [Halarchaeum rubridurum]GGM60720.1 hypothetical protein GCM10009017_08600 [Halarchaeum rubridurum]